MKKFDRTMLAAAVLLLALIGLVMWKGKNVVPAPNVAVVNGQAITQNDLYQAMVPQAGQQALNQLINQTLIQQEAAKRGVTVSDSEVQDEINTILKSQNATLPQLLGQANMTETQLKQQLAMNVMLKKMYQNQITISDKDIQNFYNQNKRSFPGTLEDNKSHIKDILFQQQLNDKVTTLVQQLQQNAKIENLLTPAS